MDNAAPLNKPVNKPAQHSVAPSDGLLAASPAVASPAVPQGELAPQNAPSVSAPPDAAPSAAAPEGVRIVIPSNTEFVRVVRLAVLGVASRMDFSFEQVEDIKLAVSEACNNAILHSRTASLAHSAQSPVEIVITPFDDRLEIEISDSGGASDTLIAGSKRVSPHVESLQTGSELRESGLGLFLMQTLMDRVEQSSDEANHTVVRMVKFLTVS